MWQKRKKIKIFSIGNRDGQLETVDLSAGKVATRATGERRQNEKVRNFSAGKTLLRCQIQVVQLRIAKKKKIAEEREKEKKFFCVNPFLPSHF